MHPYIVAWENTGVWPQEQPKPGMPSVKYDGRLEKKTGANILFTLL